MDSTKWRELAVVLGAVGVVAYVCAWLVSETIWRQKMNAIVRDREAKGETFIYVLGSGGPEKNHWVNHGKCDLCDKITATFGGASTGRIGASSGTKVTP